MNLNKLQKLLTKNFIAKTFSTTPSFPDEPLFPRNITSVPGPKSLNDLKKID